MLRIFREEPTRRGVAALFLGLLGARLLAGHYAFFWEEDHAFIATGVAALVRDSIGGGLYRYGPQLGYYRLVEWLDLALGGHLMWIPAIMTTLSVVAGAVIPVAALFLFRRELRPSERWLLAGMLAISPVLWKSAQYGNTAMPQLALATCAIVILSNRPRGAWRLLALAMFGAATLIRADAVLLTPLVLLLLWRQLPRRTAITEAAAFGVVMAAVYAALLLFDPRMDSITAAVLSHVAEDEFRTFFFDYLIWAISPIPLAFAVLGLYRLLGDRRDLLWNVVAWCALPFAFYFAATTTPRYFLLTVVPISLCTAVGIRALADRLGEMIPRRLSWGIVLAVASLHLFVGLGHFPNGNWRAALRTPWFGTHDGAMPTGALLYDGYFKWSGRLFGQSLRYEGFGSLGGWGFEQLMERLEEEPRERSVLVLQDGWFGHAFHFYALTRGADYLLRAPDTALETETRLDLGGLRIMTVGLHSESFDGLGTLDLAPGDAVYVTEDRGTVPERMLDHLRPGLGLRPETPPADVRWRRFEVVEQGDSG